MLAGTTYGQVSFSGVVLGSFMPDYFRKALSEVRTALKADNVHQVPRITRVVVNVGVGKHRDNAAWLQSVVEDLKKITGQMPHERRARQAVSGFSVRQGELVGYCVTLRGQRMEDFVERFVKITLPRVRDFRGLALKGLDGHGNLSVGLSEQLPFPEIRADKTDVIFGVQATFVTSAPNNQEAEQLFRALGFPFTDSESEA